VTQGWAYGGGPQVSADVKGTVTLVEGVSFCISDLAGDIHPGAEQGLFFEDTRFLNQFELTVDDRRLQPLSTQRPEPYAGTIVARTPPPAGVADSTLLVIRRRYVGNGMLEKVTVRNVGRETAAVTVTLAVDSDFAGLFEVKEGRARPSSDLRRVAAPPALLLEHEGPRGSRGVSVTAETVATLTTDHLTWQVVVPARTEWSTSVHVVVRVDGVDVPSRYRRGEAVEASEPATRLVAWRQAAPVVTTPDRRLTTLLATSAEDLGSLRIFDREHPERAVLAAGAPWFMTLFGRDALLTSGMLLPLGPQLALSTLRTLADLQGTKEDDLTEEQPGRILHELRSGMDASLAIGGADIYYGSVDATPLFVMLLGELRRWGLARDDVDALLPHADRALEWIETYGDRDGDGFVEYQRRTDRGLVNQGWKDSFDGITFASGAIAEPPIALAEVQGYAYAAFLARAHFARELGDDELAEHWADKARTLKRRFNEEFWLPDRGYYALGLDRDKKPIDSLASNMGHCLWAGVVDEDKAGAVAAHLMSPEMFSGFGVRTLGTSMGAFNPMSYHNGSVWPHDNALVAAGLMRYGHVEAAQRVAVAMLDAATSFGYHLPELFCGFDRSEFDPPVPYPTSCSPQAWAAAAPLHVLRTLLRLDPWVPFGRLWCAPELPPSLLPLRLERVQLAGAVVAIDVRGPGDAWHIEGLPEQLTLLRCPRPPLTAAETADPAPG
jgi:glycogen debranching enzyme